METNHYLTKRKREILKSVIQNYISGGKPVGSRILSKERKNSLSSATIRNIMADLEKEGYLVQPHISAGRIPTDKGYRFYVDNLLESSHLNSADQELIDEKRLKEIIERTKYGGGELVKMMGTSAWYAPGAAAAQMVESFIRDQRRIFPVCVKLDGEYGIYDCFLGVPVILGSNGIEKIIELKLKSSE